eukprot:CCRYP_002435-RA/>CCRYP_002435-RA protein AED:0.10 eAED:0.10 QI:0/0/0/1/0/0/2/0/314
MLVSRFTHHFHVLMQSRYSVPQTARKHPFDVFECDLNSSTENQNWLLDDEFLCKYRMNCDTFNAIINLIEGDPIFQRGQQGPPQLPVKHQLMIFMHFIGREGETNANQRSVFHLGIAPCCDDRADYSGRKFWYLLTVNFTNNDKWRIRAYLSGYPGKTHDNRVWQNMVECQRSNVFFSQGGQTAFKSSPGMGLQLQPEKQLFNMCLSLPHGTAEHIMGLLKGRCGWLWKIKMQITNKKESLEKVVEYIDATIVLHNMLTAMGCDDDKNIAWDVYDKSLTAIDDENRIPERSVLDMALPGGALPGARQEQLFAYV